MIMNSNSNTLIIIVQINNLIIITVWVLELTHLPRLYRMKVNNSLVILIALIRYKMILDPLFNSSNNFKWITMQMLIKAQIITITIIL